METNIVSYKIVKEKKEIYQTRILSSKDAFDFAKKLYDDGSIDVFESMYAIFLNIKNITKGFAKISQGGTYFTITDIKIIAKYAIETLADKVILVHNHPSGDCKPSEEDKKITKKLYEALNLFDIELLDHIIVSENNYFSFEENGLI